MKALVLIFLCLGFTSLTNATSLQYSCELGHVVESDADSFYFSFGIGSPTQPHGGEEQTKIQGDYKIVYQASPKWLSIAWFQKSPLEKEFSEKDELIAMVQNVLSEPSVTSRIILAYNPKNPWEQVSLSCAPKN